MPSLSIQFYKNKSALTLPLLIAIAISCLINLKASAEPRGLDFFSINSPKSALPSDASKREPNPNSVVVPNHAPAATWFEKFDQLRDQYHPSDGDKVILTRPLMQQAERVQQWTNTASKVSKNYTLLAKAIRNIPVPAGLPDIKEYRDLTADWYQDAAGVYQDLIRPRRPAKTIEDLEDELIAVKKHSESLANNIANLKAMDRSLRQQYHIDLAPQDDAIQQFVRSR